MTLHKLQIALSRIFPSLILESRTLTPDLQSLTAVIIPFDAHVLHAAIAT